MCYTTERCAMSLCSHLARTPPAPQSGPQCPHVGRWYLSRKPRAPATLGSGLPPIGPCISKPHICASPSIAAVFRDARSAAGIVRVSCESRSRNAGIHLRHLDEPPPLWQWRRLAIRYHRARGQPLQADRQRPGFHVRQHG
jgi:hypothetical protein